MYTGTQNCINWITFHHYWYRVFLIKNNKEVIFVLYLANFSETGRNLFFYNIMFKTSYLDNCSHHHFQLQNKQLNLVSLVKNNNNKKQNRKTEKFGL